MYGVTPAPVGGVASDRLSGTAAAAGGSVARRSASALVNCRQGMKSITRPNRVSRRVRSSASRAARATISRRLRVGSLLALVALAVAEGAGWRAGWRRVVAFRGRAMAIMLNPRGQRGKKALLQNRTQVALLTGPAGFPAGPVFSQGWATPSRKPARNETASDGGGAPVRGTAQVSLLRPRRPPLREAFAEPPAPRLSR